ncbi:hypothetical protein RUND412_000959 [Rhizina undulata]
MLTRTSLVASLLLAVAQARFGQENAVQGVIAAIGGNNGEADTLAGASIGTLLAAANPCSKLSLADQVAALTGTGAVDAAKKLVQAEQNFNPFAVSIPSICSDPTLPSTAALRGILPLIDPSVVGAAAVNSASPGTLTNPLDQTGISVAQMLINFGFSNFTSEAAATTAAAAAATAAAQTQVAAVAVEKAATTVAAAAAITKNSCAAATIAAAAVSTAAAANSQNLQTFTGAVGAAADPITFSGDSTRPFEVNGDTFVNFAAAAQRTCDIQFNACADAANSGQGGTVAACTTQQTACNAAQSSAPVKTFATAAARRVKRSERMSKSRREALKRDILGKREELAALESMLV